MRLQSGKFLDVNQKKRMRKMANNTGGIPWNRIQLVEKLRTHFGDCGQAARAPIRLPMTKENIVVTSSNPIVQGGILQLASVLFLEILLSETPKSKRKNSTHVVVILNPKRFV